MISLKIHEIFESIQGESSFAGLPFVFIRLAGCNLNCAWCDTPDARGTDGTMQHVEDVLTAVARSGMSHVCVTGGEPLLQMHCIHLLRCLVEHGYVTTLETNGSLDIGVVPAGVIRILDVKCPSSGMARLNRLENLDVLTERDEVKFVIGDRGDYEFARRIFNENLRNFKGPVFVSPVSGALSPEHLANWVLSDKIPLRVHLQLHKIIRMK
ncbi:MAG TPA: radical SAM protein [bacterium]|nr:radical SAM protein [bacterium]